jgi:hypothetical protein
MPLSRRGTAAIGCAVAALTLSTLDAAGAGPGKAQCVAANESAQDLRRDGKLHQARIQLATCLSTSCPRPVREDCAQQLAELEAAMPTVVFVVHDPAGDDVSAVRVSVDGAPLADQPDGDAVALDPGEHRFELEAAGFRSTHVTVVLREGEKKRRLAITLERLASAPAASEPTDAPASEATPAPRSREATTGTPGAAQRTTGLVLGAVGLAAGLAGGVFGILAKTTYDRSVSECSVAPCSSRAANDRKAAFGQATVSDVAFVAGGALVATGLVLYITAPHGTSKMGLGPSAFEHGWGVSLRGAW